MARASIHLIKSDGPLSSPFLKLEEPLEDVMQMALIANDKVFDVIGDLTVRDGFVVDGNTIPEGQITAAMFAIGHLVKMIRALQADFNAV